MRRKRLSWEAVLACTTKCYMKTTRPKIVLLYFVFSQKFMMRIAATQIGLL